MSEIVTDERREPGWRNRVVRRLQLAVLLLLWLIPAVIAASLAAFARSEEIRSVQPRVAKSVMVGRLAQPKERPIRLFFPGAQPRDVFAPTGGTVVWRAPDLGGRPVRDGEPLLQIGSNRIVANAGSMPFYRPLARGAVGDDVQRLNELLSHAGLAAEKLQRSHFTDRTARGVVALNKALGRDGESTFEPDRTIFLPAGGVFESFSVDVGAAVAPGSVIARRYSSPATVTPQSPEGKTLPSLPPGSIRAPDGASLGFPTQVGQAEAVELMKFAILHGARRAEPQRGTSAQEGSTSDLVFTSLTYVAAEPREVAVVPVSALHMRADGRACVFEGRTAAEAQPVVLHEYTSGALGVIHTDVALAGKTIVADASTAPVDLLDRC